MKRPTFKSFVNLRETSDWKAESQAAPLVKGFVPPISMRPIINAFLNSDKIILMHDTGDKHVTLPKKALYLVGGPVRDFIAGKSIKDYDLATPATPEQIGTILSAAGFKFAGDRSGRGGEELKLPAHFTDSEGEHKKIEPASGDDKKVWYIKGRDNSKERKAFVIGAKCNGEEFDIATFRKDNQIEGSRTSSVEFADNLKTDAERRDFSINALYIELDKADGENKRIYDPSQSGLHDLKNKVVKTVNKAEDRFNDDPLRLLRSLRFSSKFGGEKLDPDIAKAIPNFLSTITEKVSLERIRDEFLKGLLDPDISVQKYIGFYKQTKLLNVVFPGLSFDNIIPSEFSEKKDKPLALAWLLQHNPVEKVDQILSDRTNSENGTKPTGWTTEEKRAVTFLLKLKEFHPDKVNDYMKMREGTGLSNRQVHDWVDLFKVPNTNKHIRPWWAKHVKTFADYNKQVSWPHAQAMGHDVCDNCRGAGCEQCQGSGKLHPTKRGDVINRLEAEKFKNLINPQST